MTIPRCLIALFLLGFFSCSKQEKAVIVGKIKNADGEISYLEELRITTKRTIDSAILGRNGDFRYRISLSEPGYYLLTVGDNKTLTLILSPGEKVRINAELLDFYNSKIIYGSDNTKRVNELHDSLRSTIFLLNNLRKEYLELEQSEDKTSKKQDSLSTLFVEIRNMYHKYSIQFILEDFSSLANIAALYQEYASGDYVFKSQYDIQFFKLVSDTLTKHYPKVRQVKVLNENYHDMMTVYHKERILKLAGSEVKDLPDLLLPDPTGKIISLSSLRGKTVLLAFWSVNQQESIENVIDLKKVYKKYHNKGFEIYQVSVDKSLPKWCRSIAFEGITWVSVCDTAFPGSQTRSLFNVNALPMNYLINNDQTEILAKNLSPADLDQTLSTLFKY
ncbi:Thiol-disulfide oxidoreductase ResA [subsurface metagenome]